MLKKTIWGNFQRIIELFTQKIGTKLSKIGVWDPGSEIRDPEKTYSGSRIPDPGVKKAPDPGSRIRIRNTNLYSWVFTTINSSVSGEDAKLLEKYENIVLALLFLLTKIQFSVKFLFSHVDRFQWLEKAPQATVSKCKPILRDSFSSINVISLLEIIMTFLFFNFYDFP